MSSALLEQVLYTREAIPCPKCGERMVFRSHAIGRTTHRCPKCDRVARAPASIPGEVVVPQTLVSKWAELPAVRPGQLRCQSCARGVEGTARFCVDCNRTRRDRPAGTNTCLGCGYVRERKRGEWETRRHCEHCPKPTVTCANCGSQRPRTRGRAAVKSCKRCPKGSQSDRVYKQKRCACGNPFQPTGPRAVRCEACRG